MSAVDRLMHLEEIGKAIALLPTAIPHIIALLEQIMANQAELDAKLSELSDDIDKVALLVPELQKTITDLNAKIGAVTQVDLTPEMNKVNELIAKLVGVVPAAPSSAPAESTSAPESPAPESSPAA